MKLKKHKRRRYFMKNMDCRNCKYYRGKRGCKLKMCCLDDEKVEAIGKVKVKRERRQKWQDM